MVPGDVDDRTADRVVGVALSFSGLGDAEDQGEGIGRARREVVEDAPDLLRLRGREGQHAPMQIRSERLEPELEGRRDPEVPAGAAEAPEELGLVGLGRAHQPAVGGDEVDGGQVVDREPEAALEAADSPAEGQPGDAGVADDPDRAHEAMRLRGDVELAEEGAAVRAGDPGPRIDLDAAHVREVDDEAAVAAGQPACGVTAGLDRDLEVVLAREGDRRRDLLRVPRASDDRRPPIMDRVPEAARLVVACIVWGDDVAARSAQLIEVAWR